MPFVQSQTPIMAQDLADAILDALSARPAAAILSTPTVHLYTEVDPPISPLSTPTDFTEATFAGYADAALPALVGPINTLTSTRAVHGQVDFTGGAVVAPGQNIAGYYVTDGGGTNFYYGEAFPAPIPIVNPGDTISLDVILPILEITPAL